ncbi:MAG: hypothetical protein CMP07_07570 [Xanthomonadales bacterium]|nr:hypothetical protein [Xanthomonadales bacterium]
MRLTSMRHHRRMAVSVALTSQEDMKAVVSMSKFCAKYFFARRRVPHDSISSNTQATRPEKARRTAR